MTSLTTSNVALNTFIKVCNPTLIFHLKVGGDSKLAGVREKKNKITIANLFISELASASK